MPAQKRYSKEAREVMQLAEERACYFCECCHNSPLPLLGITIEVHYLDLNIKNNRPYNLATLCSPCHLRLQRHNPFFTWLLEYPGYYLSHCESWLVPHLVGYYEAHRRENQIREERPGAVRLDPPLPPDPLHPVVATGQETEKHPPQLTKVY